MKLYIKNNKVEEAFKTQKELLEKLSISSVIAEGQIKCECPECQIAYLIETCERIDKTVKIYKGILINEYIAPEATFTNKMLTDLEIQKLSESNKIRYIDWLQNQLMSYQLVIDVTKGQDKSYHR